MEIIIGFLIAVAIGLTGVGGGVITAPVLILWLGLPAPVAVGSALAFVSVVKSLAVPVYMKRRQVDYSYRCKFHPYIILPHLFLFKSLVLSLDTGKGDFYFLTSRQRSCGEERPFFRGAAKRRLFIGK